VKKRSLIKLTVIGAAATMLPLVGASQAFGDYAPQSGDVVGVDGDTPQYGVDFVINGDTSGDLGFDSTTGVNRVVNFDATADSNGRQAYTQGSTESSPSQLNPTVVLRAGDRAVQRPQSSAQALAALTADTGSPETINYAASASAPTSSTPGIGNVPGGLDYVNFGTDSVKIAVDSASTNAPTGLSLNELVNIYDGTWTTWGQLPGYSGAAPTGTIIAEIPPSTSSVYSKFVAALTAVDSSFSVDGSVVKTVEQNDPTAITTASTPANAIVPFSNARLSLWNDGYFLNPATPFPGGTSSPLSPGVSLLTATAPDGSASLNVSVTDYIVFRADDLALSGTANPYQPGGTLNWVQTLFWNTSGPAPYISSPEGKTLITASGITPATTPVLSGPIT
jgi:hypothetical protein